MKVDVFNISAKKVGTMDLSDAVFAQEYNEPLVHQVVAAKFAEAASNLGDRKARVVQDRALSVVLSGPAAA